jgi:CheY-like chemotaxis protein
VGEVGPRAELPRERPQESPRTAPPLAELPSRSERLVLVAHPELEQGRRIADALNAWGLESLLVQDGVEAILTIQRELPRLVVLDAALPKMFGFQVCELVKRNESLRVIRVILVGAIHDQDRYRRPPRDLYGADAYVERHELPRALAPLCEQLGLPLRAPRPQVPPTRESRPEPAIASAPEPAAPPAPQPSLEEAAPISEPTPGPVAPPPPQPSLDETTPISEPAPEPAAAPPREAPSRPAPIAPAPEPVAPPAPQPSLGETAAISEPAPELPTAPPGEAPPSPVPRQPAVSEPAPPAPARPAARDPALAAETEQAERLARIIVSDVVLYNPEKFDAGVRDGNVLATLEAELGEGRNLFAQRVDARVGDPAEFLERELLRVARSRGMK